MKKKVCVYAISKNEEKFAARWARSMREADEVYVLDTGSADNTRKILRDEGVIVHECAFSNFRFDEARNLSLSYVPEDADICVSTDLDEVFSPGWRETLENAWGEATLRARFRFVWSFAKDGAEGTVLYLDKIHARKGYTWKYPVHEALSRTDGRCETAEEYICPEGITLFHYPDASKSRAGYLPLLELSRAENPLDARAYHYLGREYMYLGMWEKCLAALKVHLALPGSVWKAERSASCRYMARAHFALSQYEKAEEMLKRAIAEAPYLREPYYESARFYASIKDHAKAAQMAEHALNVRERPRAYVSEEEAWSEESEHFLKGLSAP